jgi:hypothetical protein
MKQRHLYQICGQMRTLSLRDPANRDAYEEVCGDLFCRLGQRPSRPRPRRKPRDPRVDLAPMSHPIPKADVLMDLNAGARREPGAPPTADATALLRTKNGQRWVVRRSDLGNGLAKLTYCDGSSSLVTAADAGRLGLTFAALGG